MLNIIFWVIQGLLALVYLMAGGMKASQPLDKLSERMSWVKDFPAAFVRFIGIAEVLGAIGLILPELTNILPWLTLAAAAGLAIIMIGAVVVHIIRKEVSQVPPSLIIALLTILVLVGRLTFAHL